MPTKHSPTPTGASDTEAIARKNLAVYYTALEMLERLGSRRTTGESLLVHVAVYGAAELSQFADAHDLSTRVALKNKRLPLNKQDIRLVNRFIQMAKALRNSRFVEVTDWEILALVGSDGNVPQFTKGQDWVMIHS